MTSPTLVLTGGAGFLGSHMCDRLIAEGFTVICLDNLLTGRRNNLERLYGHPRFAFLQQDVIEPFSLASLQARLATEARLAQPVEKVDYVLHMAMPASPVDYARYPVETLRVGAWGTYHALEMAKAFNAVYLTSSTSEVYGDPEVNPQPETYWGHVNPVGLRSMYDESKRYAEALSVAYYRTHRVDVRIARIFNTYGPRMGLEDGRVIPNFMTQALLNRPLTVFGDGSQTRSLCYVDDMVEGLFRLLTASKAHLDFINAGNGRPQSPIIVNIGNPEEITVLDLAREVIHVTDSRSEVAFRPLPADDPMQRRPDITRAQELLGWSPVVTRSEGLKKVVPYFRSALAAMK